MNKWITEDLLSGHTYSNLTITEYNIEAVIDNSPAFLFIAEYLSIVDGNDETVV